MKNYLFTFFLVVFSFSLFSFTLESTAGKIDITSEQVKSLPDTTFNTVREKHEKIIKDTWQGVHLTDLLKKNKITSYQQIEFKSTDNYLVIIEAKDIPNTFIVFKRNNELLKNDELRIINPALRDLNWVSNISTVKIISKYNFPQPQKLIIAESYLATHPLEKDPAPFKDVSGYTLHKFLNTLNIETTGKVEFGSTDGVSHICEYANYLRKAVLIKNESKYNLQSPQMPAGMWIKNISYIHFNDTVIVFINQYSQEQLLKLFVSKNWKTKLSCYTPQKPVTKNGVTIAADDMPPPWYDFNLDVSIPADFPKIQKKLSLTW